MIATPETTIADLGPALRNGTTTAVALVDECLAAIAEHDAVLNAFIAVPSDDARRQAHALDAELARGIDRGPLHGIPISLKDLIDLAGMPTTAASRLRRGHRAAADAPVVAALRAAGAVFIGKCNLHELAFGTTGEESAFGPTRNPHARAHVPGGSSSGSAVSVAAGMALASLGTDTGGSIRIPASACGVVGLKPTHGEVSAAGVVPLAPSLDHVGPLARSVGDAALLFRILRDGPDAGIDAARADERPLDSRPRLGIPRRYFLDLLEPAVEQVFAGAVERLQQAGWRVDDVELPHAADTPSIYLHTQLPEAADCHRADLDNRPAAFGRGVRLRLELGRYVLAEDYVRAQRGRRVLTAEVDAALSHRAALLLPTLPVVPPRLGTESITIGTVTDTTRALTLRLTQLFDVTGHPAISVPCGTAGGLPAGVQLVGRRGETERLLALAAACEDTLRGRKPAP
jgi:aspartyl-tRNA(Asn)/glutamyl-tRNA(Gln) amidotransferase subunit A